MLVKFGDANHVFDRHAFRSRVDVYHVGRIARPPGLPDSSPARPDSASDPIARPRVSIARAPENNIL